jgi:hypothetical protein
LVPAWKNRRRASGIVLAGVMAVLVLSGYLLYYASDDALRATTALLHWIIGAALPLSLLPHVLRGRTRAKSAKGQNPAVADRDR